jgi:hypothetical protein
VFAIVIATAGVVWPKLGLPAALVTLITLASGGLRAPRLKPWAILAGVITTVAMLRFVVSEAVPGVIQGGNTAASNSAASRLRQIVFAQDVMRQRGFVDTDGDHIGSAGLLGELTGVLPLRGVRALSPPLMANGFAPFHDTKMGPAAQSGAYLFMVCLPTRQGGWTASPNAAVDEEAAERRFLAYAWPMGSGGPKPMYVTDQHEAIRVSDNVEAGELRFVGPFHAPDCDLALSDQSFVPWRGKAPRASLPGDRAP